MGQPVGEAPVFKIKKNRQIGSSHRKGNNSVVIAVEGSDKHEKNIVERTSSFFEIW